MKKQLTRGVLAAVAALALSAAPLFAGGDDGKEKKAEKKAEMTEEKKRMKMSAHTLDEILEIPENGIPQTMLENAAGVAVIPDVVKAGFVAGARHGHGVMSVRQDDGNWSNPLFVGLTGGSIGWQAGVKQSDIVLVFTDRGAIDDFMDGEFTLGGNASVAVGPLGRTASASTSADLDAQVYVYARSEGAFAGVSMDGTRLYINKDANKAYYGKEATPEKILHAKNVEKHKATSDFVMVLNQNGKKDKS